MTLQKLAGMVQRGFVDLEDRIGVRFDGVESRLVNVENRLDNIILEIADMRKEILKKIEEKVNKIDFEKLEKRVAILEKAIIKQKQG